MIRRILPRLLLFLLVISLSFLAFFFYTKAYLQTKIQTPSVIFIPKGSTKSIVAYFKTKGIDLHWLDYYLIKMRGYPQAGWIELGSDSLSREEFFEKVTHAKAALQKVTLIPGETNILFLKTLAESLDLNKSKLLQYYDELAPYADGVIFADTYSVARGIDEKSLIDYLVKESLKSHETLAIKTLGTYDDKVWFEEIVTKASIIQKEAANIDEMPIVSAVISNRMKKNMKLQMDGTLNYGKFSHVRVSAKKIREDMSKFNTYKYLGLPPYPICAVSKEAIYAAIYPAKVDYLYFVKGKDGKHIFTKTYKEHLKNIK
jgi:UPF0755 protein